MDLNELPTEARLEQYEKQAQDLIKGHKLGNPESIWLIKQDHPQFRQKSDSEVRSAAFALSDAQLIVARRNYFESWAELTEYVEAVARESSSVIQFESAVDAIVAGEVVTLERLLRANPDLIRARSTRRHQATLLHYVGANGTEKQRTPKNAVEVAKILLDAGAEVNAVGKMYGGTTALGLVATSVHPARAGVQDALMELLLSRGAALEGAVAPDYTRGSVVNACLANGRPNAAEFLARRARLDLAGAAGVGRLDVVKSFFHNDGSLKSEATKTQMEWGLQWACSYGRNNVVEFLLEKGVDVNPLPHGETALHCAAYGGQLDIVKLLLERKPPLDGKDESYDATPLGWALYGWRHPPETKNLRYHEVVALLVAAGATVQSEWLADREVRSDPRMLAVLRGEISTK